MERGERGMVMFLFGAKKKRFERVETEGANLISGKRKEKLEIGHVWTNNGGARLLISKSL